MHTRRGTVAEIVLDESGCLLYLISSEHPLLAEAGQYFQGAAYLRVDETLSTSLFVIKPDAGRILVLPANDPGWMPGEELLLRGPIGRGFSIHSNRLNIAGIAKEDQILYLRWTIDQYLAQEANVVLYTDIPPAGIRSEIEIQTSASSREAVEWADIIYLVTTIQRLVTDIGVLKSSPGQKKTGNQVEVLVLAEMPCAGTASCGVCSIPGKRPWLLPCKDGPVFLLNETTIGNLTL